MLQFSNTTNRPVAVMALASLALSLAVALRTPSLPSGAQPVAAQATVDGVQLRNDLLESVQMYAAVAQARGRGRLHGLLGLVLRQLEGLPQQTYDFLAGEGVDGSHLKAAVALLQDAVMSSPQPGNVPGLPESPGLPSAPYSNACGDTRPDTDSVFAAQVAFQAARLVWSAASRACEQVTVVAGVGGNGSLGCIAADATLFAAESVLDDLKFCGDDVDSAEIKGAYDRLGHVHGDIEAVDTKVVVIDGKVDVLDGKVDVIDGKVDAVNGKLDDLADAVETLRVQNCEIIRLLCTSPFFRASSLPSCTDHPGFPYVFPENP